MLEIDTIESASEIVPRLHGRLTGPWVDEEESQWRRTQVAAGERRVSADLSGVTELTRLRAICFQLMRVRNVCLVVASLPHPRVIGR
jgi:hypothetical protein